jgi:pimeloyl-ACP methyl ester carboxylesterase
VVIGSFKSEDWHSPPIPTLVIRGALSDILAPECLAEMRSRKPDLAIVEIPNRGHAPTLDEPACIAAIDAFLKEIEP